MSSSKNNFRRLSALFFPYKIKIFFALFSLMVTALAILFYGFVAKNFIEELSNIDNLPRLDLFFLSFVFLTIVLAISGYFRSYLINDVSLLVANDLRNKIFTRVLKFPMIFFDDKSHSDVLSRINNDIGEIFSVFTKNITFFLRNLVLFIGSIVFLLTIDAHLFAIMILVIFLSLLPIFYLAKRLKKISAKSKDNNSSIYSFVRESLHFIKIIKSFGAENKSSEDFCKISNENLIMERRKSAFLSLLIAVAIFFAFFSVALMLYFGANDVLNGVLSGADFSSFVFYAVILSIALVGAAQSFSQVLSILQNSKRVFELFHEVVEDYDLGDEVGELNEKHVIEFKNVNFSYPSKKENVVLRDLNFKIKKGQKISIIGESGSGKSSIFSLLFRFYDVNSGDILVNDRLIGDYRLDSLRGVFAYVMQENLIFSGTIYDNIVYPNAKFTKDQVKEIILENAAFDFIADFDDGLDLDVGNMGSKLSGGQKQRIAILRAILSDCEILIFDEATSALDEKNEELMIDLIEKFTKDKTVIFVSHKELKSIKFDSKIKID